MFHPGYPAGLPGRWVVLMLYVCSIDNKGQYSEFCSGK
jgi:hypothetical protein